MNQAERRRFEHLLADRREIEQAAAWLREQAWQGSYAGLNSKDRAFVLATLLESLALQLYAVPDGLRVEAVRAAQWMTGGSRNVQF